MINAAINKFLDEYCANYTNLYYLSGPAIYYTPDWRLMLFSVHTPEGSYMTLLPKNCSEPVKRLPYSQPDLFEKLKEFMEDWML